MSECSGRRGPRFHLELPPGCEPLIKKLVEEGVAFPTRLTTLFDIELMAVQPLPQPAGLIYYLNPRHARTKRRSYPDSL